jgi:hypothetical protein
MKAIRMGRGDSGKYCTHSKKNADTISVKNTERNILVLKPKCRWEDNLKINFKET